MESKELRIGNLFQSKFGTIFEAVLIDRSFIGAKEIADYEDELIHFDHLDAVIPIPLTEEWLVRFGIEKYAQGYWIEPLGFIIFNEGKPRIWDGENYDLETPIDFVHQLQNLFYALSQTELEIK